MRLEQIYKTAREKNQVVISFEVYPPKGEGHQQKVNELLGELNKLKVFSPAFISVTYGAGGSSQQRTFEIVNRIKNELKLNPMVHFTCVGAKRSEIKQSLQYLEAEGIENILALRGDPPAGESNFKPPADGFGYANELVDYIRSHTSLSIAVAAYPECHPEAESMEIDIENLKRKVDAGAQAIITQLFFDNTKFFRFIEKVRKAAIHIPVIPGIMPIRSFAQIERMLKLSNATLPPEFGKQLEDNQHDKEVVKNIGIDFAVNQCRGLLDFGIAGIHLYPLNKADIVTRLLQALEI